MRQIPNRSNGVNRLIPYNRLFQCIIIFLHCIYTWAICLNKVVVSFSISAYLNLNNMDRMGNTTFLLGSNLIKTQFVTKICLQISKECIL